MNSNQINVRTFWSWSFYKRSKVRMSYFENKPLFMSLKVRFTDIVIVYFYDILIDQSIPWLNQVTLNKVNIPKQNLFSAELSIIYMTNLFVNTDCLWREKKIRYFKNHNFLMKRKEKKTSSHISWDHFMYSWILFIVKVYISTAIPQSCQ